MKNVCFFNSINFWGGGEKLHLEYALEFRNFGYNVCIFALENGPLWQKAQAAHIPVFAVSAKSLSFLNPLKVSKVARLFKDQHIDTVVFTTSQDMKLGGISAKKAGVKNIVYLRGLAVAIKNSAINRHLFSKVLTHVVANSKETERKILAHLPAAKITAKMATIYHGIDVQESGETKNLPQIETTKKGVVLGNAGRLTLQKGQSYLLDVAKILADKNLNFTLYIAGTGELETSLREKIGTLGLEKKVLLLGFIADMPAFMKSLDVFLLTSAWEGFGFVLVEAMQAAKPVVAFNVSSNPEIITQNKTGFLVDFADVNAFADAVEKLISDQELRKNMGENGQQDVACRFERVARVREFEAFLLARV